MAVSNRLSAKEQFGNNLILLGIFQGLLNYYRLPFG